jgi:diguanylate cyclase (GGDEF)-like protein
VFSPLSVPKELNFPISCFMIDFDNFKLLNDKYGHTTGDIVLKNICKLLKNFFRSSDLVIRFGGEEVLILLYNVEKKNAILLADKVRNAVEINIVKCEGFDISITISIGVASAINFVDTPQTVVNRLIDEADKCLYKAKANGKNRVEYN